MAASLGYDWRIWLMNTITSTMAKVKHSGRKFMVLGLLLAKCRIAIKWLNPTPPIYGDWYRKFTDWAVAEEIRMKHVHTDDKLAEDVAAWAQMLQDLGGPDTQPNTLSDD
ncbi:hypothetical protein NDU88_006023 [Pleurodeles waltl]|uniref:Uncharacterized protein n=1 Tax=Pleurodeles waltl TaxID=8319 RepID=A0AAV7QGF4_PLEWA|nr:hypothetical protein NDU88_006023 [Pleurodeles waltl]